MPSEVRANRQALSSPRNLSCTLCQLNILLLVQKVNNPAKMFLQPCSIISTSNLYVSTTDHTDRHTHTDTHTHTHTHTQTHYILLEVYGAWRFLTGSISAFFSPVTSCTHVAPYNQDCKCSWVFILHISMWGFQWCRERNRALH